MRPVPAPTGSAVARRVTAIVAGLEPELLQIRRHLHAHPETAWMEHETTAYVADRLRAAGLEPHPLKGTGLTVNIGADPRSQGRRRIGLRADLDALPVSESSGLPFASARDGYAHACGHDVHTTALLGAALTLKQLDDTGDLPVGVRCIFQPAEEVMPGGAVAVIDQGALDGVDQIYALHCDPKVPVGQVGSRIGAITAASDTVTITVTSDGGHTSRPHLTGDVVFALGQLITTLPAVLGRRMDPRAGVNLTWGAVHAGKAANAIPASGSVTGTIRCLDGREWHRAAKIVQEAVEHVTAPFDVEVELNYARGIPPVVNEERAVRVVDAAAKDVIGPDAVVLTEQSLGGEDFAWYLTRVPGALVRLGTRTPGGPAYDLHRGDIVFDERAIGIGARVLVRTALLAGDGKIGEGARTTTAAAASSS
ncbi:amidohydrolase [Georgenia soli]|uniref:Amidohydrolase n=1 Tax=Georgenia soli TaxID=638953 RepID=A0A2A9ENK6_9MICO|nr:amidohydrolase [Georgenia soli]PFG40554.1 amidohydrolase [Georgenia soli]